MKCLFVYRFLTRGGVESVLRARVEGLPRFGVEARAWFLADGEGRDLFRGVEDRIQVGGIHDLQRFAEHWQPEVLATVDTAEVIRPLMEIAGSRVIVIECHTPYRENRLYLHGSNGHKPVIYFVPSEYQKREISSTVHTKGRVAVIPNPLREIFLKDVRMEGQGPPPIVAWVGRLDHLKNWAGFFNVASKVGQVLPDVEYWLVGSAPGPGIAARIYREANARGVLGRLRWFNGLAQEHLPNFLDRVRESGGVLVSTSRNESFGMTVAEAMARQCAVVVPRSGPFPEFVEHGVTGLLYASGRLREAAQKIVKLITNGDMRESIGRAARTRVLASHSPDVALRVLADTLHEIAFNGHP